MTPASDTTTIDGTKGSVTVHLRSADDPTHVVLLAHGYAEHALRYEHVMARLVADGAAVYAPDHLGHGASEGTPALTDIEAMAADLGTVHRLAAEAHPGLPVVLIGHSLGGLIGTRYLQTGGAVDALVLSGPFIGDNPDIAALLTLDPMPDVPLDPAALSRDLSVGEAYVADPLVYTGPFQRASLEDVFGAIDAVKAGPALGAVPTLWIHGEHDPLAKVDEVRKTVGHLAPEPLTETVYAGAMHEIFNETNKDEVLDDVAAFIRTSVRA